MSERLVSNTGPLIGLAGIDRLDLLQRLYAEIIIPDDVHAEILGAGEHAPGVAVYRQARYIQRHQLSAPLEIALLATLDTGEAAVIQLARELGIPNVLIDERKGRKVARTLYQLHVIGTVGILIKAKRQGLIANVRDPILAMRANGYHLHAHIVNFALQEVGERL